MGDGTREREQINDKQVYIMPKSAPCNINRREAGGDIAWVFVCECECAHVDQEYFGIPG